MTADRSQGTGGRGTGDAFFLEEEQRNRTVAEKLGVLFSPPLFCCRSHPSVCADRVELNREQCSAGGRP